MKLYPGMEFKCMPEKGEIYKIHKISQKRRRDEITISYTDGFVIRYYVYKTSVVKRLFNEQIWIPI